VKVAALTLALVAVPPAAQAQDSLRDRLDEIYGRGRYHRDLPLEDAVERPTEERGAAVPFERGARDRRRAPPVEGGGPGARRDPPVERDAAADDRPAGSPKGGTRLLIAVAAVAAALLLFAALRARRRRRPPVRVVIPRADAAGADADRAPPDAGPGSGAEALAAQGRFAEAIRALLAAAIERILARSGSPVPPALTGRELLADAAVPSGSRDALAGLVRAVEITLFGGRPAGEADYAAAAVAFERVGATA
jgi:hypothetical protein